MSQSVESLSDHLLSLSMGLVQDHFVGLSMLDQPGIISLVSVCGMSLGSFPLAKSVGSVLDHRLGLSMWGQFGVLSWFSVCGSLGSFHELCAVSL